MFLNRYLEKIFKVMDEIDKKEKPKQVEEIKEEKKYCSNFIKADDGFCKHYMGCKVKIVSCANECAGGGINEKKKIPHVYEMGG